MDGSRIRNEKVADSKISGYVWTGPKLPMVGDIKNRFEPPSSDLNRPILGSKLSAKCFEEGIDS